MVWFPAGEKHWHGAAPDTAMSHIAIQEAIDGSAVTWMEKASDADYADRSSAPMPCCWDPARSKGVATFA